VPELEPVDLSFFDEAPVVVRHQAYVDARRDRVFAAVANDPAGWGEWFPGFSNDGSWQTPLPHGVGSIRTVRMLAFHYRETMLAWEDGVRWAFRIDETNARGFKAFAEDYLFADDGTGTRLTWIVAVQPSGPMRFCAPALPLGCRVLLRRAASRLGPVASAG
jgi:Polyketide cyclase / dehydrase and lipid transport